MELKKISIATPSTGEEEWQALREPIFSGWLTQGSKVAQFENDFAKIHEIEYALATSNCTTALHLALIALGVGEGDEVIVPSFTWVATANAVEYVRAKPVFCDVDRDTYNIDVNKIEKAITPKTKAIIPVHLFGLCADMDSIKDICKDKNIKIIEDAACAIGASYKNKKVGSLGEIGCFSFHPRKTVTTGEGGMCTTNNQKIAETIDSLRNHGASVSEEQRHSGAKPYILPDFNIVGFNYRMTDLQGAVGIVQLKKMAEFIKERRFWAKWYQEQLSDISWINILHPSDDYFHSYQSFVCYINEKKSPLSCHKLMEFLHEKGISTRPGTQAVHMLGYYSEKYRIHPDDYPGARDCGRYTVSIPLHNKMTETDYKYVVKTIKELG